MQGKLIIKKSEKKKLQSAAHFAGVKLGEALDLGDETHVESSAREAQNYFNLGQKMSVVDGTELDAIKAAAKAKEEAKAKAAAKK